LTEEAAIQTVLQQVRTSKTDYKLCGADLLDVTVFQQPDFNRKVRVSQNGTISFPLIGTVTVGGLSVGEAEAVISRKLAAYLINPQVSIFITEYGNKKVFVLGEVKKPGSYDLPTESQLTVLEAISLAEGFTAVAAPDRTKVIRVVDGKNQVFMIVVSDITRNGQKEKDITLEPNDVIYVPQSFF
jgi:polysaccharide export outer membrane protein